MNSPLKVIARVDTGPRDVATTWPSEPAARDLRCNTPGQIFPVRRWPLTPTAGLLRLRELLTECADLAGTDGSDAARGLLGMVSDELTRRAREDHPVPRMQPDREYPTPG